MTDPLRDVANDRKPKRENFLGGRSNRKEYWIFVSAMTALSIVLNLLNIDVGSGAATGLMLIVNIRRFHDIGRSGWWAVALMVAQFAVMIPLLLVGGPVIGLAIAVIVAIGAVVAMGVIPGQPFENRFGPPPGQRNLAETFG